MSANPFQTRQPAIAGNPRLRSPQREAYEAITAWLPTSAAEREVGIVLPVGCGKSGLITLIPFATHARRVLVVAPNVKIAQQLLDDFNPTRPSMFYLKCGVLSGPPYPEPAEIRGRTTNRSDLDDADVVVTNIHQLQGEENRWLSNLPADFFDLIMFDEAHHNVASSWELVRRAFPGALIVNMSATPQRADGQLMAGRIIYSFPIFRAVTEGYVKRLKALVLNPKTLRFVREDDGREVEVSLDEVRRLGEEDADFRRSILTSKETLTTIVDASLRELDRIRASTGDQRHTIIASALNHRHCIQIVEAYEARGRRAAFIHSREDAAVNDRNLKRLANHELDVIVQVRKLGEGFDHPYLSVAAVFSVFGELSPFVQFVGRIMRVIAQNAPASPLNQGTVVFHAGANIARRWADFQEYSQADQAFFDQLLPLEGLDFQRADELTVEPRSKAEPHPGIEVRGQGGVLIQEVPLLAQDDEARKAFEYLRQHGFTADDYDRAATLEPVPTTRQLERRAARRSLDAQVREGVGRILAERGLDPLGFDLDTGKQDRTSFAVVKAAVDRRINAMVGRSDGERSELSRAELELIERELGRVLTAVAAELAGATVTATPAIPPRTTD